MEEPQEYSREVAVQSDVEEILEEVVAHASDVAPPCTAAAGPDACLGASGGSSGTREVPSCLGRMGGLASYVEDDQPGESVDDAYGQGGAAEEVTPFSSSPSQSCYHPL